HCGSYEPGAHGHRQAFSLPVIPELGTEKNWRVIMTILSGEEVDQGAAFNCQKCNYEIRVRKGESVPKCPHCGHDIFEDGDGEETIH
ncbi:MAG TPA: hypothetical protein VMT22_12805, partial [Terriglobales bacterium]|nr:hypothetical protein [Terriglobales bacterium]